MTITVALAATSETRFIRRVVVTNRKIFVETGFLAHARQPLNCPKCENLITVNNFTLI